MQGKIALKKYRLLRTLGRGSNGEVSLAHPLNDPSKQVVVKVMHPHATTHPKFRQLFEAEVQSMKNFSHPYAVQFIDASLDDPSGPSIVMEYVPGQTLEGLLLRSRTLDAMRVGRLLGYLCHALQAAAELGIIHRDLKPANLMVVGAGTVNESLKVMDFGFAGFAAKPHLQLAALTGEGPINAMGTPAYVSPEMIRGDSVDCRSDLYSVGVMLYEMLTGRLPFTEDNQDDLLASHLHGQPPKFSKIGVIGLPPGVEAVVQMTLAKYPNERPQSPKELADMFGRALDENIWEATAPVGWEPPMRMATEYTPQSRPAPSLPADPYQMKFDFEMAGPESMVAVKIRGFVDDQGGEVMASEPGVIRLRLCMPGAKPKGAPGSTPSKNTPAPTGSGIFSWFRTPKKTAIAPGEEPIEMELSLEKPDLSQSKLSVGVLMRPVPEFPLPDLKLWRPRCERLQMMLKRYLGA